MLHCSYKLTIALSLLFALALAACTGQGTLGNVKYKNYVLKQRAAKDVFFKNSPQSPLLDEQQWRFATLRYFPVDRGFNLSAEVRPLAEQTKIVMQTSTGHDRLYFPRLFLTFTYGGKTNHLTAYQDADSADRRETRYFVPFKDLTSGKETYGAGRYIEFDYTGSGLAQIDFNFAYNPYCAYNYNFSCPLPPPENTLTIAVTAGEMSFKE